MKAPQLQIDGVMLAVGAVAVVGLVVFIRSRAKASESGNSKGWAWDFGYTFADDIAGGVVDAVDGAVAGTVGAVGEVAGLPTPSQTVDDPAVVRWIIDNVGHWEASKWGTASAWLQAEWMDAGTGKPPAVNSAAGRALLKAKAQPAPAPTPSTSSSAPLISGASFGDLSGYGYLLTGL